MYYIESKMVKTTCVTSFWNAPIYNYESEKDRKKEREREILVEPVALSLTKPHRNEFISTTKH